jgi:hypothetical protein
MGFGNGWILELDLFSFHLTALPPCWAGVKEAQLGIPEKSNQPGSLI